MPGPTREFLFRIPTVDTERPVERVPLEQFSFSGLPWKEYPVQGRMIGADMYGFKARAPIEFGEEVFDIDGRCTVQVFRNGRRSSAYNFDIGGRHHGVMNALLMLESDPSVSPTVYANTDIRRYDSLPDVESDDADTVQQERSFPPHMARTLYARMLDWIAELSKERSIEHIVNKLPDEGTTFEQWDRAFRDMLLQRGYINKEGSVQYRKLYEKGK